MKPLCSLVFALALSLPFAPAFAADPTVTDKVLMQDITERVLVRALQAYAQMKSPKDVEKVFGKTFNKRDAEFLKKFSQLKTLPKIVRLNRGFQYEFGGKTYTFVADDIFSGRYTVNDKVKFNYSPDSPFTVQVETLIRGLEKSSVSKFDFLIPQANAGAALEFGAGVVSGALIIPVGQTLLNDIAIPSVRAWFCKGKNPLDYTTKKACGDYFANSPDAALPAVPKADLQNAPKNEVTTSAPYEKKCSYANDPDFWVQYHFPNGKIIRRTIKYDGKDPKSMTEQQLSPYDPNTVTYDLKSDQTLVRVHDTKDLFLSRDPADANRMDNAKFELLKAYDLAVKNVGNIVDECKADQAAALAAKASLPGSAPLVEAERAAEAAKKEVASTTSSGTAAH